LFDVINAVDIAAEGSVFGSEESEEKKRTHRDWSVVGANKESKLMFMDNVRHEINSLYI
jgi:hypothetical protein